MWPGSFRALFSVKMQFRCAARSAAQSGERTLSHSMTSEAPQWKHRYGRALAGNSMLRRQRQQSTS
jgi:hypothetical protein